MTTEPQSSKNFLDRKEHFLKAQYLALGLVSGFPLALSGSMIQMWLSYFDVSLAVLGWLSILSLPYGLKFLWTALLELYYLGSCCYRFWMIGSSLVMSLILFYLSILNPTHHLTVIITLTFFLSFFSATFDTMLDGYRLNSVPSEKMGIISSCYVLGYRIGLLLTGGLGAIIADPNNFGFQIFYTLAASCMLCMSICLLLFLPSSQCLKEKDLSLKEKISKSCLQMIKIQGIGLLVGIIMTYRLCDTLLAALSSHYFQHELGYSLTSLGFAYKISGLIATIAGTFIGGLWLDKKGVFSLLNKICFIQGLANFSYLYLYYSSRTLPDLFIVVLIEHFCGGIANSACVVLLSKIALPIEHNKATAYALLSALFVPARVLSGFIAASFVSSFGWPVFILFSASVVVIPISLVYRYNQLYLPNDKNQKVHFNDKNPQALLS